MRERCRRNLKKKEKSVAQASASIASALFFPPGRRWGDVAALFKKAIYLRIYSHFTALIFKKLFVPAQRMRRRHEFSVFVLASCPPLQTACGGGEGRSCCRVGGASLLIGRLGFRSMHQWEKMPI